MQKVFSHESLVLVSHVRNLLDAAGINTVIKNEQLSGALGEIPYLETWPELWVGSQADATRARALIAEGLADAPSAPSWTCSQCGEMNEGQFAVCWQCQQGAPA